MKEPDYWYEAMIEGDLSVPILSALIIFNGAYWANISYLKNWTSFLKLIIIGTSTFTLRDSHIADFEYHEIPQVVKVIRSVVLRLSRVAGGHE